MDEISRSLGATQREASRAASRALNRTASRVRTYASRAIRDAGYGLKVSDVKRQLKITKAAPAVLAASVTATGKSIPLIQYSARQTTSGVSVNVLHGRKTIPHAFIQTMHSGHRGVFIRREARTGAVKGLHRQRTGQSTKHGLPIDELYGPGVPAAFANEIVQHTLVEQAEQYFPVAMRSALEFQLSKRT